MIVIKFKPAMGKLNEDGIEEILGLNGEKTTDLNNINILKNSKKRRVSVLDDIAQEIPEGTTEEIVIPTPLAMQIQQKNIAQAIENKQVETALETAKIRSTIKGKAHIPFDELASKNQEVHSQLQLATGKELPGEINYVEVEEEIESALQDIPDGDEFGIQDIEIHQIPDKKDKTGYFKTKVNIGKNNIPDQINKIASYVKKQTKGLISPRVCDLRVIANTNKTQLRSSALKLSAVSIVFKPDFVKLKVNKGTRFIISVPENYESSGNILVYLQESRAKTILEISSKEFASEAIFNEFIGDRIAEYYFSGYDVVMKKLELRNTNNPLMGVINEVLSTHEYKAKPYVVENHIIAVDFVSKSDKNQWLYIQVTEGKISGTYDIHAKNTVDSGWNYGLTKQPITIGPLIKNIYQILDTCYNRDWSAQLNIEDEVDNFYYLLDKLTHYKLRNAFIKMHTSMEQDDELGIVLKQTLSKKDTAKAINKEYDAEAFIGKTKFVDYFIITYLAYQIVGGDVRAGKDYITRQQYYGKYNVKDRRSYQERDKTILKKEGTERNYNARPYIFQIEYSVKGRKHIYRTNTFDDLLQQTGITTDSPQFPETKY